MASQQPCGGECHSHDKNRHRAGILQSIFVVFIIRNLSNRNDFNPDSAIYFHYINETQVDFHENSKNSFAAMLWPMHVARRPRGRRALKSAAVAAAPSQGRGVPLR
jgi:hypothetical protein